MFKKFFFLIMLLLAEFLAISFNESYSQLIEKKEFRLKNNTGLVNIDPKDQVFLKPVVPQKTKKSMLLAGALSFIVPGAALGQFYKEEFLSGVIRLGISGLCVLWVALSPPISISGDGPSSPQKLYAVALFTVNWIVSVIDALIPTKPALKKYRYNYYSF